MRIAEFVELDVYDGKCGCPTMVNLTKVILIVPMETGRTKILFENKEYIIVTNSYDVVVLLIKSQLND